MLVLRMAEFQVLGVWLLAFWRRVGLLLGWDRPPEGQRLVASETPSERVGQARDLGFESVLPGMIGRVVLPAGPGQSMIVPLKQVTVSDVFGAFQYLAETRERWPFEAELGRFAAYVVLDGPGWELTVFFGGEATERVEYYARKASGGAPVSGVTGWEALAQALMLSPDYEAVVGYLALRPYWTGYYVA